MPHWPCRPHSSHGQHSCATVITSVLQGSLKLVLDLPIEVPPQKAYLDNAPGPRKTLISLHTLCVCAPQKGQYPRTLSSNKAFVSTLCVFITMIPGYRIMFPAPLEALYKIRLFYLPLFAFVTSMVLMVIQSSRLKQLLSF